MPNPWDLPHGGALTGTERFVADKADAGSADDTVYYTPEDVLDYVEDNISSVGGPDLSDDTPAAPGTASPGLSEEASRADHVHRLPTLAELVAAPLRGTVRSSDTSTTLASTDVKGTVTVTDQGGTNKTFTLPIATQVGDEALVSFVPVDESPSAATLTLQLESVSGHALSLIGPSTTTVGGNILARKLAATVVGPTTYHVWATIGSKPTAAQVGAIPTMDPAPAAGTFLKADGAGGLEAALFTETDLGASLGALHAAIPTLAPLLTEQVEISASRSLTDVDAGKILVCDTSGGAITLTAPHDLPASWNALVIREGANNVVIDGSGGQTLVGPAASSGTVTIAVDEGGVTLVRRSATRVWAAGVIA